MKQLRVTPEGLRMLAGEYEGLAGKLAGRGAAVVGGESLGQSSAAAVAAIGGRVDAVGVVLAAWAKGMAGGLRCAAGAYESQNAEAAAELDAKLV
jgi:hypothetical protein